MEQGKKHHEKIAAQFLVVVDCHEAPRVHLLKKKDRDLQIRIGISTKQRLVFFSPGYLDKIAFQHEIIYNLLT